MPTRFQCSEKCKMNEKVSENEKIKFYDSFGRTKKQVEDDVKIVAKWLKTQPHLPEIMSKSGLFNKKTNFAETYLTFLQARQEFEIFFYKINSV